MATDGKVMVRIFQDFTADGVSIDTKGVFPSIHPCLLPFAATDCRHFLMFNSVRSRSRCVAMSLT